MNWPYTWHTGVNDVKIPEDRNYISLNGSVLKVIAAA
jgi:hypothetical protein